MKTVDLVLARMREPIDWIVQVKPHVNVIIYCFAEPPISIPRPAYCIQIADAGQEAGAYTHHIVNRFDTMADVTIFSQADPVPHINGYRSFINMLHCIADAPDIKPYEHIGDRCFSSADDPLAKRVWRAHKPNPNMNYGRTPLRDACRFLLNQDCPQSIEHAFGGIFSASRSAIQKHPMEFWRRMNAWCAHSPLTVEAAIMEKLWEVLLNR